ERALDGAQQVQFHVAAVAAHGIQLELPDAVFGAEAAVEALHDVVHGCSDGLDGGDEILPVHAFRLEQIEVDIAVADVAEGGDANARTSLIHGSACRRDERRHCRYRH